MTKIDIDHILRERDATFALMLARAEKAEAEVEGLREALEFYADPEGWNQPPYKTTQGLFTIEYENQASKIRRDRGAIARAAIGDKGAGG